jgi:hypothetical protein
VTGELAYGWDAGGGGATWMIRVIVSDIEVRLSVLPLDKLLASYGIDTTRPYTQIHLPERQAHLYVQEGAGTPPEEERPHDS